MSRLKNRPGAQAARTGGGKAKRSSSWLLVLYDLAIMTACWFVMSFIYSGTAGIELKDKLIILGIFILTVYLSRIVFRIYRQIWRYGGIQVFIRLILADILAFCEPDTLYNAGDIAKGVPSIAAAGLSVQRVSAMLTQLVNDGSLVKTEDKRKSFYSLA